MKKARRSCRPDYECQKPWPESCFVQCGGYMASEKEDAEKLRVDRMFPSFIEAFPKDKNVDTFIRANAETIEEAEEKAWKLYQKYLKCEKDHADPENFERRDYKNGLGFCKTCGQSKSEIFEPSTKCIKCGKPTDWTCDVNGDYWCKFHAETMPEELVHEYKKAMRRALEEVEVEVTQEDIKTVLTHLSVQAKEMK